jgi:hypothetical protein
MRSPRVKFSIKYRGTMYGCPLYKTALLVDRSEVGSKSWKLSTDMNRSAIEEVIEVRLYQVWLASLPDDDNSPTPA